MKKQILGFVNIASLIDNTPTENSPLGEVTTWSLTYSKHKGEYAYNEIPGYLLTTFSVQNMENEEEVELEKPEALLPIEITKACQLYANTHTAPLDPFDFKATIQAEFFDRIKDLEFGELIAANGTTLPAWFSFKSITGDGNEYRIWLADEYFQRDYPLYDVTVVAPLVDLNDFLRPWSAACELLDQRTTAMMMIDVQDAKTIHPETYIRYLELDFVNRTNPTQKKKTQWWILIYGIAGDYDDICKDAIIEELKKQTGQDDEIWQQIFPELYKRTEFILYPQWDNISIPNMSTLTGLYSSIVDPKEALEYVKERATFYSEDWIEENSLIWPVTYKTLSVVSVDGQNNMEDQLHLRENFPDYLPIPSTDPDFQRMSIKTQNWVHFILGLIIAAETATSTSSLPKGARRMKREGNWYIFGNYERANYYVFQRSNQPIIPVS